MRDLYLHCKELAEDSGWSLVGLLAGLIAFGVVFACSPRAPSSSEAESILSNVRFERHANGLCFAVISFTTYNGTGTSISAVPTEACR